MVFAAAGQLHHDEFVQTVAEKFSSLAPGSANIAFAPATESAPIILRNKRSLEQVQLCLGVPSPKITDENRYASLILNTVLGGGMSSRLFQTIREERGMAYSIYSDLSPYSDTGSLCVYAGTSADKTLEMIALVMAEFKTLKETLLSPEELNRAKEQVKGNILLGLESSSSRMSNLARQEMYFNHFFSVEEVLDRLDAVTADQVQQQAHTLFHSDRIAVTLLGRLDKLKLTRKHLLC